MNASIYVRYFVLYYVRILFISKGEYEYSYVVSVGNEEYESRTSKRSAKQPFLTEDIKMIEYPGKALLKGSDTMHRV